MINNFSKIYSEVDTRQRGETVLIMVLILLGMATETISVSMIVPALNLFANESAGSSSDLLAPILQYVERHAGESAVLFMATLLASVYIFRGFIIIVISRVREKFIAHIRADISKWLFSTHCCPTKG